MSPTREVHADGWCVRLDTSRQVLRLDVPEAADGRRGGPPLSPVPPLADGGPVSAATLLLKAKLFDDRLYAAVEPSPAAGGPSGDPPEVLFCGDRYGFAVPVVAEVYVSRLLDRDEFRRHCDRFKTRDAILANLG